MSRHGARFVVGVLLIPLLAGCYLVSGERIQTAPLTPGGTGEYTVQVVSADGETSRQLSTGVPGVQMGLEVVAVAEEGELTVEIFKPNFALALGVTGRYGLPGQGRTVVDTDENGTIHYRIVAREVRNGTYMLFYRIQEKPTPTPQP